ncbi:MAG: DUF2851 family protein [Flavobacteriaceae bacterium]
MQEDFLHYLWRFKKLPFSQMTSTDGKVVSIVDFGMYNQHTGPDFFNARILIGEQLWAGNVEMHLKSSDWYAHGHELDKNYDNVILHVVWEDDVDVFRMDGSKVSTLCLRDYVPGGLLGAYHRLKSKQGKKFVNCEGDLKDTDTVTVRGWLQRLYIERLQHKSNRVQELLRTSRNNWEAVLFTLLLKGFGSNVNGEAFLQMAKRMDFSVVRKIGRDAFQLESVFFGLSGLLQDEGHLDTYHAKLRKEYQYLAKKFSLDATGIPAPGFFRLRPSNFPTVRLSQLADLYAKNDSLFQELMHAPDANSLRGLLSCTASTYWDTHYTFGKTTGKRTKGLTESFKDILLINAILPVKFCYGAYMGKPVEDFVISLASGIPTEKNSIVARFIELGLPVDHAMDSQSVLELYHTYCTHNRCMQCAIGTSLLTEKM